jgi:hypothetical protein
MTYYPDLSGNNAFGVRLNEIPAGNSGNAFPATPTPFVPFFRTDIGMEFYWDGTRWLSNDTHSFTTSIPATSQPLVATNQDLVEIGNPWHNQFDLWLTDAAFSGYLTAAASSWTLTFRSVDGASVATVASWTHTTPASSWTGSGSIALGTLLARTVELFQFGAILDSGAASLYLNGTLRYRLVG